MSRTGWIDGDDSEGADWRAIMTSIHGRSDACRARAAVMRASTAARHMLVRILRPCGQQLAHPHGSVSGVRRQAVRAVEAP